MQLERRQQVLFHTVPNTVTIQTGENGRQAGGAVRVSMGDTEVLVTAVAKSTATPGRDFFPLTVNYVEKHYAAGRIPGGFFKREGRPTERRRSPRVSSTGRSVLCFQMASTTTCRWSPPYCPSIPRSDPDIPSLLGASAALAISGLPFMAPSAPPASAGRTASNLLNPTNKDLTTSDLHLVVAGTRTPC